MLRENMVWDMCVHTVVSGLIPQVRGQGMSVKITECLDLSRITMKLYCIMLYLFSWMFIYIDCLYYWFTFEVDLFRIMIWYGLASECLFLMEYVQLY